MIKENKASLDRNQRTDALQKKLRNFAEKVTTISLLTSLHY